MAENNFEQMLKKITENQEVMAKISQIAKNGDNSDIADKLPDVISAISPLIDSKDRGDDQKDNSSNSEREPTSEASKNVFSLPVSKLCSKVSKNSELLLALKPYLSKERCDAVDSIVKMAQVANLMKIIQ